MNIIEQERVACGDAEGDVRVLHRLDVPEGFTGRGNDEGACVCAVVDVETTGLDHDSDALIQLAMRRFRYDADGVITRVGRSFCWYEDPGRPIPANITRLTGIGDADVAGHSFPEEDVVYALTHVDLIVAHNAQFDRPWIEARFPDARGMPWGCSMRDPVWELHGMEGGKLALLGVQCGFFYDAHRADVDVDAVIGILGHSFDDGRTVLSVLVENAEAPSWMVRARGAAFDLKGRLRARGYRWDPSRRVWAREIRDADRFAEEAWLAANVYAADARPQALGPDFERVTARERYA
jgi:DNA polymerase III subunit epsilon